jgi:putative ABC transport system permease protein
MFFNHKYLYEGTGRRVGAGTYGVEIEDPAKAGEVSKAIDSLFENSDAQTKTETEAAFTASFISLAGNLAFLLNSIGLAVIFTILLVTANTMSMAVRERRTEIAVLKTLGFPSALVLGLILGEALLIAAIGGGLGLLLSGGLIAVIPKIPMLGNFVAGFRDFHLSPAVGSLGFAVSMVLGLFAGLVPATLAYKARITDMLRQV